MYTDKQINALQEVFGKIIMAYHNALFGGEINETYLNQAKIEYNKIKNPVLPFEHLRCLHDKIGASDFRAKFNEIVKNFMKEQESNSKIGAGDVAIEEDSSPNLQGYIDCYDNYQLSQDFNPVIPAPSDLFTSINYASVTPILDAESFPRSHIIDILEGEYQVNIFHMMASSTRTVDIRPIVSTVSPNIVALSRGRGEAFATGILIHQCFVLTARHSLEGQDIREIAIKSNFQKNKAGIMHFGDLTYCSKIVENNKVYDYAIIQLVNSVNSVNFNDSVKFKNHIPNSKVLFFHHPGGGPKKVSCHEVTADSQYETLTLNGYHDTIKGSSGGVYVDAEGNIVAMHSLGKQRTEDGQVADSSKTTGVKIGNIIKSSQFFQTLYSQNEQLCFLNNKNIVEVLLGIYYLDVDLTTIITPEIESIITGKPVGYPNVHDHRPSSLTVNWSYHHIIPKGNMEFMWIMGKEYKPLNDALIDIAWQSSKYYKDDSTLTANSVIWSNWNLFIGPEDRPTGTDPGFDPHDGYTIEPANPSTFPKKLWDKITEINTKIEECFNSRYTISAVEKRAIIDSYTEKSNHERKKGTKYNKAPTYDSTKSPHAVVSMGDDYKTKLDELCNKLTEIKELTFSKVTQVFGLISGDVDSVSTILSGPWFHKTTNNDWTTDSSGKYLLKLPGSSDVSVSNVMEVTPSHSPTTIGFAYIHYDNDFLNNILSWKIFKFAAEIGKSEMVDSLFEITADPDASEQILIAIDELGVEKILEIFFGDKFKISESEILQFTEQKVLYYSDKDKNPSEIISSLYVTSADIENKHLKSYCLEDVSFRLKQHSSLNTKSRLYQTEANSFIELGQFVPEHLMNIPLTLGTDNNNYMLSNIQPNDLPVTAKINVQLDPEQFLSSTSSDDPSKALSWEQRIKQNEMQDDICRNR